MLPFPATLIRDAILKGEPLPHCESFGERSEDERGEKCQRADHEDRAQKAPNLTVSVRKVPAVAASVGFAATEPATAIMKMIGDSGRLGWQIQGPDCTRACRR